jgi:NADH-quinone oxidoreductase subunit C
MPIADAVAAIQAAFPTATKREFRGETTLIIAREQIVDICRLCRDTLGFDYLIDIASIDNFGEEPRFEMVYELSSIATNDHLRLKFPVSEDEPSVPTVSSIWPTANWHEREIYDMMGLTFTGHPDLRRILMWEGYPYFPLRKDFPLAGKPSEVPEVAVTKAAPLEGGPFVTLPSTATTKDREPRARRVED